MGKIWKGSGIMACSAKIGTMMVRRTIMSDELSRLFLYKPELSTTIMDAKTAVIEENCLGKISMSARQLSFNYLKELYSLDSQFPCFVFFKMLWLRNATARNLLAFQFAAFRDVVLRDSAHYFLEFMPDSILTTEKTQEWVEKTYHNRFSKVSACSVAKDLNSSWSQAGFFQGTRPRCRKRIVPTAENIALALYLAARQGERGMALFENDYVRVLDVQRDILFSLAEKAAQQGLLIFRHLDDVIEVQFPRHLWEEKK